MRADQESEAMNDIFKDHGFSGNFTLTIQNDGAAIDPLNLTIDNTDVNCFSSDALIEAWSAPGRGSTGGGIDCHTRCRSAVNPLDRATSAFLLGLRDIASSASD